MKAYFKITLVIVLLTCLSGNAAETCPNIKTKLLKAQKKLGEMRIEGHSCSFLLENESLERKNFCDPKRKQVSELKKQLKANCPLKNW